MSASHEVRPAAVSEHDLVLSVRGANVVKSVGVKTVGELVRLTADEILETRCFGETSLREIQEKLAARGLRLGMSPAELRGRKGLQGRIVAATTVAAPAESPDHEHEGSCCGHCEVAARKLRERLEAGAPVDS